MIPLLKALCYKFFFDPQAFVGWARAGIVAVAGAFALYSDQIEAYVGPHWSGRVKVGAIILAALAVRIRAGDKTPENIKVMSASMSAGAGEKPTGAATAPALKPVSDVIGSSPWSGR
jgi:hypothetical protein